MPIVSPRVRWLAGDLLASMIASALIAVAVGYALPAAWPPWAAMPLGMAAGMALAFPCWLAVGPLLGAVEPMLVTMLGGMAAGMAAAMTTTARPAGWGWAGLAALGAICGAAAGAFVAVMDWLLRGEAADG